MRLLLLTSFDILCSLFFAGMRTYTHLSESSSHGLLPVGIHSLVPFAGCKDGGCWSVLGPLVEQVEVI
jgi:hypothetical protein